MLVEARAEDIVYTDKVSGIFGNFLRPSLARAGIRVEEPGPKKKVDMDLTRRAAEAEATVEGEARAWKHIWSAGQGVATIHDIPPVADLVARLEAEYDAACRLPRFGG